MSGICGVVHQDGAPANRAQLEALTAFMAFRGPDAQAVWVGGPVGLGHTMLQTTDESTREHQPCSLDGGVWITADARIDGRDELKKALQDRHAVDLSEATDVDLILHAYRSWDTDCLQHLIGDFAFALWDAPRQRLFCARDHFGIKPFFYAQKEQQLIFSNTLNCVRQHPAVSSQLNDLAIADFLLFQEIKDASNTAFADIQRLPPAHALTWSSQAGLQVRRYWTLPDNLGVRHRAAGDYVEHFKHLLNQAVSDRLRTRRVGIEMSGGLDSSSIAATALGILSAQSTRFVLQAQSVVYDQLIPDQERHFSGLAAQHLGIPIHYIAADHYKLYERWDQPETQSPEPTHNPQAAMGADAFRGAAALSRVFLTGWDGDALLSESLRPHFRKLAKNGHYARLALDLMRYAVSQRTLLPTGWGRWVRNLSKKAVADGAQHDGYPDWLNTELEVRYNLRERWRQYNSIPPVDHPTRPYAYRVYQHLAHSTAFFDGYDAGHTGLPLEYRHPLMDLRLLDFCLSLPLQPWTVKKYILREAMRGVLPEAVRTRPKASLPGFPHQELLKQGNAVNFGSLKLTAESERYVSSARLKSVNWLQMDTSESWSAMVPMSLQAWLTRQLTDQHQ